MPHSFVVRLGIKIIISNELGDEVIVPQLDKKYITYNYLPECVGRNGAITDGKYLSSHLKISYISIFTLIKAQNMWKFNKIKCTVPLTMHSPPSYHNDHRRVGFPYPPSVNSVQAKFDPGFTNWSHRLYNYCLKVKKKRFFLFGK